MPTSPAIRQFTTASGYPIYRLTLNAFPNFWTYAYLVLDEDRQIRIDTSSEFDAYNQDLEETVAHIEYLYQRGMLCIHNLEEIKENSTPHPISYSIVLGDNYVRL